MSCLKGDTCNYPACDCKLTGFSKLFAEAFVWQVGSFYKIGDQVRAMGALWECTTPHTSTVFGNDAIIHKYWQEYSYE